jgi:hypothetical protein
MHWNPTSTKSPPKAARLQCCRHGPIALGGAHATLYADDLARENPLDFIEAHSISWHRPLPR